MKFVFTIWNYNFFPIIYYKVLWYMSSEIMECCFQEFNNKKNAILSSSFSWMLNTYEFVTLHVNMIKAK
jgi:hypothetical protein